MQRFYGTEQLESGMVERRRTLRDTLAVVTMAGHVRQQAVEPVGELFCYR